MYPRQRRQQELLLLCTHTSHDTCYKHVILFLYTLTWFNEPIAHRSLDSDINTGEDSSSSLGFIGSSPRVTSVMLRYCHRLEIIRSYTKPMFALAMLFLLGQVQLFLSCLPPAAFQHVLYSMSRYSYASHWFHHLFISSLFLIRSWLSPLFCFLPYFSN